MMNDRMHMTNYSNAPNLLGIISRAAHVFSNAAQRLRSTFGRAQQRGAES